MQITKELVGYVAELSRLELDEVQTEKMQQELGAIVEYMDILSTLDTTETEPLSHIFAITNVMRDVIAGDFLTAVTKFAEVMIVAMAIAIGIALPVGAAKLLLGGI